MLYFLSIIQSKITSKNKEKVFKLKLELKYYALNSLTFQS